MNYAATLAVLVVLAFCFPITVRLGAALGIPEALGAAVLGVSADDVKSHGKFHGKYGLNFPLLSDPGSRTARAWGAWGEREIAGERSEGPLRTTIVLDEDGVVLSADYRVDASGHVADLLDALRQHS